MKRPPIKALILDFDGVILESLSIKTEAFRKLFSRFPRHVDEILRHHIQHSGVNRTKKFEHIYRHILKTPLSNQQKKRLEKDFSKIVFRKILKCRFVPGARRLLATFGKIGPVFLVSATPEKELKAIIARRGLRRYFRDIAGAPTTKTRAIRRFLSRNRLRPCEVLCIGDARADWLAARATGVHFMGRSRDGKNKSFPQSVRVIANLTKARRLLLPSKPAS
jgi:phosphoglycolate phosphatase-like HAD superfamily hydrolase